jgi:transketolase
VAVGFRVHPPTSPRASVVQASTLGWRKYLKLGGRTISMRTFGSSAPLKDLQEKLGFTPQSVAKEAMESLGSLERGN